MVVERSLKKNLTIKSYLVYFKFFKLFFTKPLQITISQIFNKPYFYWVSLFKYQRSFINQVLSYQSGFSRDNGGANCKSNLMKFLQLTSFNSKSSIGKVGKYSSFFSRVELRSISLNLSLLRRNIVALEALTIFVSYLDYLRLFK